MQRIPQLFSPTKTWESQVADRLQEFTCQMLSHHNEDAYIVYKRLKAFARQIESFVSDSNLDAFLNGTKQINADAIINDLEQALRARSPYSNCVCIKRYCLLLYHNVHLFYNLYRFKWDISYFILFGFFIIC